MSTASATDVVAFYLKVKSGDSFVSGPTNGAALAAQLEQDFVQPLKSVLPLLQGSAKLTRMVMRISPNEMTKDPIFAFHPNLPDVARTHEATLAAVCRKGSAPADAFRLAVPGMGSYVIDAPTVSGITSGPANNATDPRFKTAPAALVIEVLDESGPPVRVHADDINLVDSAIAGAVPGKPQLPSGLVLKPAPARWNPPKSDPPVTGSAKASVGGLLGFVIAALWVARRRKVPVA